MDPAVSEEPRPRPWWRPRWYELAPELVVVGGLTFFVIDEQDAATSAFKSSQAVALMAGGAVAWVALRVVLVGFLPWSALRVAIMGVCAWAVLAVVVLPAYDDETVVEAFPRSLPPAASTPITETSPGTPLPSVTVPSTGPTATVAPGVPAPTVVTTVPQSAVTTTTVPPEPVLLRTGMFMGIDHRAEGTVSIYRAADGHHVVGLESFDIQPGPDYDVYMVPGPDRQDRDGGSRLDDLRDRGSVVRGGRTSRGLGHRVPTRGQRARGPLCGRRRARADRANHAARRGRWAARAEHRPADRPCPGSDPDPVRRRGIPADGAGGCRGMRDGSPRAAIGGMSPTTGW